MVIFDTDRLKFRTWNDQDVEPYFQINQDSQVTEFLTGPLTYNQVFAFVFNANNHFDKHGFTLWAVELKATGELIGFIGLSYINWDAHFTPAVEIAWRLGTKYWGFGYATEGAKACLNFGFKCINLEEIVAFTVPSNVRSIHVMEKIGMLRDWNGDFAHPKLELTHPLSKHILYRIKKCKL